MNAQIAFIARFRRMIDLTLLCAACRAKELKRLSLVFVSFLLPKSSFFYFPFWKRISRRKLWLYAQLGKRQSFTLIFLSICSLILSIFMEIWISKKIAHPFPNLVRRKMAYCSLTFLSKGSKFHQWYISFTWSCLIIIYSSVSNWQHILIYSSFV